MNKFEKFACLLLGAGLMWYLFIESPRKAAEKAQSEEPSSGVQLLKETNFGEQSVISG